MFKMTPRCVGLCVGVRVSVGCGVWVWVRVCVTDGDSVCGVLPCLLCWGWPYIDANSGSSFRPPPRH